MKDMLKDKVAWVTGASSGMGEATVEAQVAEHDDGFTAVDEQHGRNLIS